MTYLAGDENVPTAEEVGQLLDDPNPRGEVQRGLAMRYIDRAEEDPVRYGFADENEFNEFKEYYKERYSISDFDLTKNIDADEDAVSHYYSKAKDEYDVIRSDQKDAERSAVNGSKSALGAIEGRSSDTEPGVGNSNEIFDVGLPGIRCFEIWVPLLKWAMLATSSQEAPPEMEELQRLYDEQRDIPFDKFKAGCQEFRTLADSVRGSAAESMAKISGPLNDWSGGAADQAKLYQTGYEEKNKEVADGISSAADDLDRAISEVSRLCQAKVDWLLENYFDMFANEISAQDMERIIRIAEGNPSLNDIKHCIKFFRLKDYNTQDVFNDDCGDLDEDTIETIVAHAQNYLMLTFNVWMNDLVKGFRKLCEDTRNSVDQAWTAYSDLLAHTPDNPYGDVGKPPPPPPGAERPGGTDSGGPGSGPDAPGGTGPASTGGAPPASGGAPPMPEMPKPEDMKAPEPSQPEPPTPGMNPVTGTPLETDPETGEAYPIDPATGEAIKDGQQPEKTTIKHGDSEISLTEPDAEGRGEVSIDDGTGDPRDFAFDFGDQTEPGAQPGQPGAPAPGQPGVPGHPGAQAPGTQVPGVPGQPVESAAPGVDPAAGFGPQGAPEQPPQIDENGNAFTTDESGAKVYVPGEDGKIHMRDGDLDIVAERPSGPDGPTVVTVTDASGTPTTYTLGGQADGGAGAPGGTEVSGELGGQPDPQVQPGQHQPPSVGAAQAPSDVGGGEPAPAAHSGGGGGMPDAASAAHGAPMPEASVPSMDGAADMAPGDQSGATSPQSFADAIGGAAAPGGVPMADGVGEPQDETQSGASAQASGQPGAAGLGAAPGGADPSSGGAAGGNGMGMMGGMGGAAGGGGGDDQERSARAYKVEGDLFDSGDDSVRISGTLGDVVR